MALDLDHTFVKAIHLLHSRSKESVDVLKQMYDDAVALKLGLKEPRPSLSGSKQENIFPPRRPSPKCPINEAGIVSAKSKKFEDMSRKHELGKRSEKFSTDNETGLLPSEAKRHRLDSPRVSPGQSPVPHRNQESTPSPTAMTVDELVSETADSNPDGSTDADEFALEMGLVCVVCRQIDVAPGNQLIECQECHSLYHQECHRPPATDHDVNDPRLVWYCAKCKKNMKKIVSVPKPQKPVVKQPSIATTKDGSFNKAFKSDGYSSLQLPFKRVETKASSSSGVNKPTGMAGLAANLSSKSSSSSSSSSSSKNMKLSSGKSLSSYGQSSTSNPIKGLASLAMSLKPSSKHSDKSEN